MKTRSSSRLVERSELRRHQTQASVFTAFCEKTKGKKNICFNHQDVNPGFLARIFLQVFSFLDSLLSVYGAGAGAGAGTGAGGRGQGSGSLFTFVFNVIFYVSFLTQTSISCDLDQWCIIAISSHITEMK